MSGVTLDSISLRGSGVVRISQPANGHRFTLDSILLADFCRIRSRDRIMEPGAGTGVISILLAKKFPKTAITAVEMQPEAAGLCRWNAQVNGVAGRLTVLEHDISRLTHSFAGPFDAVVANPPFRKSGSGKKSPDAGRRSARQDQHTPLQAWLDLGRLLKNGGRYFLIFPAQRAAELLWTLRTKQLEPKRIRHVHPFVDAPAALVLVEAVRGARPDADVLAPLIIHGPEGKYSDEVRQIYDVASA